MNTDEAAGTGAGVNAEGLAEQASPSHEAPTENAAAGSSQKPENIQDNGDDDTVDFKLRSNVDGPAIDQQSAYFLSPADIENGRELLELSIALAEEGSTFLAQLMQIASGSMGRGLDAQAHPIILVALRTGDLTPLLTLALMLCDDGKGSVSVIEYRGELAAKNSPALLAEAISREHEAGRLRGDTIVFILGHEMRTRAWEKVSLDPQNQLYRLLQRLGKHLIIGFEVAGGHHIGRVVNPDTNIAPVPWALPMIFKHARKLDFSLQRVERQVLLLLEKETAWRNPDDDKHERGRFQQLTTGLQTIAAPNELQVYLESLLNDPVYNIEETWEKKKIWVSEAFGLLDFSNGDYAAARFPCGPASLRQAILFTAAFCGKLPGQKFMDIVRASVDLNAPLKPSELLEQDRADLLPPVAGSQTDEQKSEQVLPVPRLGDYFQRYFDRLCREYEIGVENGYIVLSSKWAGFPLAAYIGENAPVQAASLARHLLANIDPLHLRDFVESAALIDILASAKIHLAASFDNRLLINWLTEHTFRPFIRQIEEIKAVGELAEKLKNDERGSASALADHLQETNSARSDQIAIAAGWQLAEATTLFWNACRRIADAGNGRRDLAIEEESLLNTILDFEDWPEKFEVSFCTSILLLDPRAPGTIDRRSIYAHIRNFIRENDADMRTLRKIFSGYLNLRTDLFGAAFGELEQAERILRLLQDARYDSQIFWDKVADCIVEHLLNFDIRWPPSQGHLLGYELMNGPGYTAGLLTPTTKVAGMDAEFMTDGASEQHNFVLSALVERFFSVAPAVWLARGMNEVAVEDSGKRLRDCLFVLIDGLPMEASVWRAAVEQDFEKLLLRAICAICGVEPLDTADELQPRLFEINLNERLSPSEDACLRVYSLFWAAVLIHWRFRKFGVAPIEAGSPRAATLKAVLLQMANGMSREAMSVLIDGLDILAEATSGELECLAGAMGDDCAAKFYRQKATAISKMSLQLQRIQTYTR